MSYYFIILFTIKTQKDKQVRPSTKIILCLGVKINTDYYLANSKKVVKKMFQQEENHEEISKEVSGLLQ